MILYHTVYSTMPQDNAYSLIVKMNVWLRERIAEKIVNIDIVHKLTFSTVIIEKVSM